MANNYSKTALVPLTKWDIKWLIGRYEQDAVEADAVGVDESVEYDDGRIKELTTALNEHFPEREAR